MSAIGLIGDSHHTNRPDLDFNFVLSGPRFYSEALTDIGTFVTAMDADVEVEAIFEFGDFIDIPAAGKTKEDLLDEAEAALQAYTKDAFHVIGNWDMSGTGWTAQTFFARITQGGVNITPSLGSESYDVDKQTHPDRYYSFALSDGVVCIVLDTTGEPVADSPNYKTETTLAAGSVPPIQLSWLADELVTHVSAPAIVVLCHSWLYPDMTATSPYFNLNNAVDVIAVLEAAPGNNVIAVFQSHHHPGGQGWWFDSGGVAGDAVYTAAVAPSMSINNGIKYFPLRTPIVGWGDSSSAVNESASNAYYKAVIKEFVKDVWDVKLIGYGSNAAGASQGTDSYLVA